MSDDNTPCRDWAVIVQPIGAQFQNVYRIRKPREIVLAMVEQAINGEKPLLVYDDNDNLVNIVALHGLPMQVSFEKWETMAAKLEEHRKVLEANQLQQKLGLGGGMPPGGFNPLRGGKP